MAPDSPRPTLMYAYPNEAYVVMIYRCRKCAHRERIWNSRDGVTPFLVDCRRCGGEAQGITPKGAQPQPGHRPQPGERIFVSTVDADYREQAERLWEESLGTRHARPDSQRDAWIEMVYQDTRKRVGEPKCVTWQPDPVTAHTALQAQVATLTAERDEARTRLAAAEALPAKWKARQEIAQRYADEGDSDIHEQAALVYAQVIGELRAALGGGADA